MKLIIDDAHIDLIKKIYEYYPVDGVTTNPSILAKSGRQPFEVLKEIRSFIGEEAELHVQVVAKDADGMVDDAHRIVKELGANTYVKVPSISEGFKAMKALAKENINITATAIYTPMQAYLAAKCGASYAAPYVNRIDNMGFNGIQVAKQIHDIFKNNNLKTEVLAASFKNLWTARATMPPRMPETRNSATPCTPTSRTTNIRGLAAPLTDTRFWT